MNCFFLFVFLCNENELHSLYIYLHRLSRPVSSMSVILETTVKMSPVLNQPVRELKRHDCDRLLAGTNGSGAQCSYRCFASSILSFSNSKRTGQPRHSPLSQEISNRVEETTWRVHSFRKPINNTEFEAFELVTLLENISAAFFSRWETTRPNADCLEVDPNIVLKRKYAC